MVFIDTLVNVKNPCGQDLLGVGTSPTSLRPGLGACQEFFLPKNAVCKRLLLLLYWDWSTSCKRYLRENPQDFLKKLNTTMIPILQIRKHQWDKFGEVQESCPRVTYSVTGGASGGDFRAAVLKWRLENQAWLLDRFVWHTNYFKILE